MACPGKEHWQTVRWILRYLKGTTDVGLTFDRAKMSDLVVGYVDSDFARDLDKMRSLTAPVLGEVRKLWLQLLSPCVERTMSISFDRLASLEEAQEVITWLLNGRDMKSGLTRSTPRIEVAMVNARIHKIVRATNAKVGYIGLPTDFNYDSASLDLGLVPESSNSIESAEFVYLMGADDVKLDKLPKDAFVVYQGHHGDHGVYHANVILPATTIIKKEWTYKNTEGCAQQTLPEVPIVGDARDD
ncbi:hypothetical protein GH714_005360 [Hevea brasiliensis]|uniref:Molybdopterin oxidoreductase domain-containing protein n=1 Tax=Hevea brasiliensis TaxID=3981 RepID=A0A6A6MCA6_HEVBR|nr:hypothetical protein GH714_005360 [Hevea brasiliensis]